MHLPIHIPFIGFRREEHSATFIGMVFFAIVVLSGSVATPFSKQLTQVLTPLTLIFLMEAMTLLSTLVTFGTVTIVKEAKKLRRDQMLPIVLIVMTSGIVAPFIAFSGLRLTTAINAELFDRSSGLFLFLFAIIFLKERVNRTQVIAGLIVLFGIITIALQGFSVEFVLQKGDMLVLLSAVIYSTGSIIYKKYLKDLQPELMVSARSSLSLLFFLLIGQFIDTPLIEEIRVFPLELFPALVGFGFIACFLSRFSFYEAMNLLPAHVVSLALPLSMIGGVTFAMLYLGEPLHWYHAIGGMLMILGIVLIQLFETKLKPEDAEEHLKLHSKPHA